MCYQIFVGEGMRPQEVPYAISHALLQKVHNRPQADAADLVLWEQKRELTP
jgi:hypothetical protein